STSIRTAAPAPRSRRRHHCTIDKASAVSSTSLIPAWNAPATRLSNACVTVTGSVSVSPPAVPITSRAGSSEPSTSKSEGSLSIPVQNESSPIRRASCACDASRCAQPRNEVPRAGSAATPPRANPSPPPPNHSPQDPPHPPAPQKRKDHQKQTPRPPRPSIDPNRLQQSPRTHR